MKKIIFVLTLALVSILFFSFNKTDASEVNVTNELNQLVNKYTNDGVYVKNSQIYLNEEASFETRKLFHAQSTHLIRTTYYSGDSLWMSQGAEGEGVKYSYYGTHYTNGLADGVTNAVTNNPLVQPENAKIVLSGEGKTSMEEYYVTMKDMNAAEGEGWQVSNGVYTSTNIDVIDEFRQFTAPCFLELDEYSKNYFTFTKVSIEEIDDTLVLSLYVSSLNVGSVSTDEVEGHCLFSQAIVSYPNVSYAVNGGERLDASYDEASGNYTFEVSLHKGEYVNIKYFGENIDLSTVALEGVVYGSEDAFNLYSVNGENGNLYTNNTLGGVYQVTYNPLTNTLTSVLKDNVLETFKVGQLVSKTWPKYEAFTLYARRNSETISIQFVSDNDVFTSEGRNSQIELYFVVGDKLDTRDGNVGVTRFIIKSTGQVEIVNYGKGLDNPHVDYRIDSTFGTVIDLEIPYSLLGCTNEDVFGLTCGLWSNNDVDWAPMYALDTTTLAVVENLSQYVRCDKDNLFFAHDKNEHVPTFDKAALIKDYKYGFADPANVKDSDGDEFYLRVNKTNTQFVFDMVGFGTFEANEHVKLVLHTSEVDGSGWVIQDTDVTFLVSKEKATKATGQTAFWDYVNFNGNDIMANNQPVFVQQDGYFTLTFAVDFTEIPQYTAQCEVSFIALEFWDGNIFNGEPWNKAMTVNGVGVGDPAAQTSYQIIQEKQLSVNKEELLASYKYQFSTNYYANITKGVNGIHVSLVSFTPLQDNHFVRIVVDTDGVAANGGWALDSKDVNFIIYKDRVYTSTGKTGFWNDEHSQFHNGQLALNSPMYINNGDYWTIEFDINYSELGSNINKDSVLKALIIAFTPGIQNNGFNFDGVIPGDVAVQNNYFLIK